VGQFAAGAAGYVFGKEIRRNIPVPYPEINFDEIEVSSDDLVGSFADISYLTQNSKGII
jgi:hypothetical protein